MVKFLTPMVAAGLAAAALAMAGPITAHAAGTAGGPCSGAGTGHPVQHVGIGHHSFTDSHDNCVNFSGTNGTAFLNGSDSNFIDMGGNLNTVHDFNDSDHNVVLFESGSSGNTLSATRADGNSIDFTPSAVNDVVNLLSGTSSDSIIISGSGVFANVFGSGDNCLITSASPGNGTDKKHLGTVFC